MGPKMGKPFYCGISKILIPSFAIRLCSPTSFQNKLVLLIILRIRWGIMSINNGTIFASQNVRYFNCSWISRYSDEDESLFCGGDWPLRVETIILMENKLNLYFFKPIFILIVCYLH